MGLNESGTPLAQFEFRSGALRGSGLALHARCLVHRGASHLETLPLAAIAAVRVSFERSGRKLGWGAALLVLALVVFAASAPLASLAGSAAADLAEHARSPAGNQGIAGALHGMFRLLEALASLLPVLGAALALGAAALVVFGWWGETTLFVASPGVERSYTVRGRNTQLLEFAEALSERAVDEAVRPA